LEENQGALQGLDRLETTPLLYLDKPCSATTIAVRVCCDGWVFLLKAETIASLVGWWSWWH